MTTAGRTPAAAKSISAGCWKGAPSKTCASGHERGDPRLGGLESELVRSARLFQLVLAFSGGRSSKYSEWAVSTSARKAGENWSATFSRVAPCSVFFKI